MRDHKATLWSSTPRREVGFTILCFSGVALATMRRQICDVCIQNQNMNSFHNPFIEPGAPKYFRIQRHTDVVHLKWDKPLEPNGVLIGYTLQYHTGELTVHKEKPPK